MSNCCDSATHLTRKGCYVYIQLTHHPLCNLALFLDNIYMLSVCKYSFLNVAYYRILWHGICDKIKESLAIFTFSHSSIGRSFIALWFLGSEFDKRSGQPELTGSGQLGSLDSSAWLPEVMHPWPRNQGTTGYKRPPYTTSHRRKKKKEKRLRKNSNKVTKKLILCLPITSWENVRFCSVRWHSLWE